MFAVCVAPPSAGAGRNPSPVCLKWPEQYLGSHGAGAVVVSDVEPVPRAEGVPANVVDARVRRLACGDGCPTGGR